MSYKLDYGEAVPNVVERLEEEHAEVGRKLSRIAKLCEGKGEVDVILSLLRTLGPEILRHAVEEEAIVARAIMGPESTRAKSGESVKILQEHRRIKEFFEDELPYIAYEMPEAEVRKEVSNLVNEIAAHHESEEKTVFPLAREADAISRKKREGKKRAVTGVRLG